MQTFGPDPNEIFPNKKIPSLCYIKNVITRPNIIVGDYTYYDDIDGADKFEEHVTHHYDFIGDKLIIGKFCAIAKGVEFTPFYFVTFHRLFFLSFLLPKSVIKCYTIFIKPFILRGNNYIIICHCCKVIV